jgi:hypothetical protein
VKDRPSTSVYTWAIRSIFPLAAAGMLLLCIGMARDIDWLARVGTTVFIAVIGLWGFANGGGFLWGLVVTHRRHGRSHWRESFWSSLLYVVLTVFFLAVGCWAIWFSTRVWSSALPF